LEVLGDGTIGRKKALGVSWGFEPAHASFPLPGRLVGILGAIVEISVLPVLDSGQHFPFRCAIAPELIRNDHAWHGIVKLTGHADVAFTPPHANSRHGYLHGN
jgi:hypothetical protein